MVALLGTMKIRHGKALAVLALLYLLQHEAIVAFGRREGFAAMSEAVLPLTAIRIDVQEDQEPSRKGLDALSVTLLLRFLALLFEHSDKVTFGRTRNVADMFEFSDGLKVLCHRIGAVVLDYEVYDHLPRFVVHRALAIFKIDSDLLLL